MSALYHGSVIDPHHQLWDLSMGRHPWLQRRPTPNEEMVFGSIEPIRRDYGVTDYFADAAGPALASMLVYLLMAVVLAWRPQGLFPANR